MLCQKCGKNEATNYYEYNLNGQKTQLYLCPHCAQEMGLQGPGGWANLGMGGFGLPSFLFSGGGPAESPGPSCQCGATAEEVRRTGRPGCPRCYKTFAHLFDPMVRRIHGSAHHTGVTPKNMPVSTATQLERLRAQLGAAVAQQEFEQAAQLRDAIRQLEQGKEGQQ